MRLTEPVGEDAIFGNPIEDAVGSDDRRIDRAGEDQETDNYDEGAEEQFEQHRAVLIHGEPGDQVVFVNRDADRVRDDHHEQQGRESGEYEAVNGDDDGGAFQVLELGMGELAIDLGKRFFAAHGQHRVAEGDQDAEDAELSRQVLSQVGVLHEAERFIAERAGCQVWAAGRSGIPASEE